MNFNPVQTSTYSHQRTIFTDSLPNQLPSWLVDDTHSMFATKYFRDKTLSAIG